MSCVPGGSPLIHLLVVVFRYHMLYVTGGVAWLRMPAALPYVSVIGDVESSGSFMITSSVTQFGDPRSSVVVDG